MFQAKFEFEINVEKKIVEAGDGVYIEINLLHSAICLEEDILIDTFSPVRRFIKWWCGSLFWK